MNTDTHPTDAPAPRADRWPAPELPLGVGLSYAELIFQLQSTAMVCVLTPQTGASKRAARRLWSAFAEQARQRELVVWRIQGIVALCGGEDKLRQDDRDALMLWAAHQPDLGSLFLGEAAPMHELLGAKCPSGWDEWLDEPGTAKRAVSVLLANLIHRRAQHLAQSALSGSAS